MIYNFKLNLDWKLINDLSKIDRFGGSWVSIEKREINNLKELKSIATVRSIGASTRIEGSKMTDDEVQVLLENLSITKLEERDQQEVAGYFRVMDIISESYRDIDITESTLKHLHSQLMKYSDKDSWHKGDYKQQSNEVEATRPDGTKYTIFKTTEPGLATTEAMQKIIEWYKNDRETHPIVRSATFIYEFLSIHPFQDGNGRLSRLLATLLLLKHGYSWIEYVSFEHEIENRKPEYYSVLMDCQRQRPDEDIHPWIIFFLDCLSNIQDHLMQKLEVKNAGAEVAPRQKKIYHFIENHPGVKSGEIADKLNIPLPTIKRILTEMLNARLLVKHGTGAGTNYTVENNFTLKKDLVIKLTNDERKKEFQLMDSNESVSIKKIILVPKFEWVRPDEWTVRLLHQGLVLRIGCFYGDGASLQQDYVVSAYNNPEYYQPVFTLPYQIEIPKTIMGRDFYNYEYPVKVSIDLLSSMEILEFDVMLVYDETGR